MDGVVDAPPQCHLRPGRKRCASGTTSTTDTRKNFKSLMTHMSPSRGMPLRRHLTRAAHVPICQLSAKASQVGDILDGRHVGIDCSFPRQKGESCHAVQKVEFL
jgi:hypothetical protein